MYAKGSVDSIAQRTSLLLSASQAIHLEEAEDDDAETQRLRRLKEKQKAFEKSRVDQSPTPDEAGTTSPPPPSGERGA